MPFAYYRRLNRTQQRVYQRSDEIGSVRLPAIPALDSLVDGVARALESDDRAMVEAACQRLAGALARSLKIAPVRVEVLATRPSRRWGELHGLYRIRQSGAPPTITVWMRTAKRKQVVAFKTFLRTFIHEICHHLDYELLDLRESFHTEGFYKRESSIVHQLTRSAVESAAPSEAPAE